MGRYRCACDRRTDLRWVCRSNGLEYRNSTSKSVTAQPVETRLRVSHEPRCTRYVAGLIGDHRPTPECFLDVAAAGAPRQRTSACRNPSRRQERGLGRSDGSDLAPHGNALALAESVNGAKVEDELVAGPNAGRANPSDVAMDEPSHRHPRRAHACAPVAGPCRRCRCPSHASHALRASPPRCPSHSRGRVLARRVARARLPRGRAEHRPDARQATSPSAPRAARQPSRLRCKRGACVAILAYLVLLAPPISAMRITSFRCRC